jgi:hypothetical protein
MIQKRRELRIATFVSGILLVNFPLLSVFNKPVLVFGIPLLFCYIFFLWAFIIFMTYMTDHKTTLKWVQAWVILFSLLYLVLLLFGIATLMVIKMSKAGQSIVNNPYVYSHCLLAVYCTVWTFYGSVGRAAETGLGFAAVYLGPTHHGTDLVHGHAQNHLDIQTIKGHIYS